MRRGIAWAAIAGGIAWVAATTGASAQTCAAPGTASTACTGDCATITVGSVTNAPAGSSVSIPISFSQGQSNGMKEPDGGFDKVAAIAFTLGIPGDTTTPLTFTCENGDLAPGAVTVDPGIANNFTVVVENAQCSSSRTRCLCPDTTMQQTLDNVVNIVVYGPKTLPDQGTPVPIPVLPANGTLLTLNMQISPLVTSPTIPLHIYSALDGSSALPHFAANLSIGDQAACDVTANTQNRSNVAFNQGSIMVTNPVTPTPGGVTCVGDCNGDHQVLIGELIVGVNIALGSAPVSSCPAFADTSNMVNISQLIKGVNNALEGCPAS